ncbi:MAG: hypothetical protein ABFD11_06370 [Christensenella sp.]
MTRRIRREPYDDDDGRTIVNLNVDGMPGYRRSRDEMRSPSNSEQTRPQQMLSKRETRMILFASMKWAFLFSAGFSLILILFILFCVKVWFA